MNELLEPLNRRMAIHIQSLRHRGCMVLSKMKNKTTETMLVVVVVVGVVRGPKGVSKAFVFTREVLQVDSSTLAVVGMVGEGACRSSTP